MRVRIAVAGAVAGVVLAVIAAAAPAAAAPIGSTLILSSLAIFVWAVIGVVMPRQVGLPTRWHAVGLWAASVTVLVIGGAVTPDPPARPGQAEETGSRRVERPAPVTGGRAPQPTRRAEPTGSPTSSNLTAAQRNAVRSADSYLRLSGFSRQGLIDQLSSEFGDQYSVTDATAAVISMSADWNDQAARSAATYLEVSGFSCQGLIDQLSSEFGDKYTVARATYGATQAEIR